MGSERKEYASIGKEVTVLIRITGPGMEEGVG